MFTGLALAISTVHGMTNRIILHMAEAVVPREAAGGPLREVRLQVTTGRLLLLMQTSVVAGVVLQHRQTGQSQTVAGAALLLVSAGLEVDLADSGAGVHRRTAQATRQRSLFWTMMIMQ